MILVTGISGTLGGLIFDGLSARGDVDVVGGTRSGDGSTARRIDFDEPETLAEGFQGVDVLVFVSAGYAEDDVVIARHGAVVDAAAAVGVRHVIYTSLAGSADHLTIAVPHRWTESRLAAAPFAVTILRNALYTELLAGIATSSTTNGLLTAPLGTGRIPTAPRKDLADAATRVAAETNQDLASGRRAGKIYEREGVAELDGHDAVGAAAETDQDSAGDRHVSRTVELEGIAALGGRDAVQMAAETDRDLASGRHAGKIYELEGVAALGGHELADVLGRVSGRSVEYRPGSLSAAREAMVGLEPFALTHMLSIFSNANAGFLEVAGPRSDLTTLLPAPPRPVRDVLVKEIQALTVR